MSITIRPGGLVTLDPNDKRVITFDWDAENLGVGVLISTSAFTITSITQTGTALTKDSETILAGTRKTQLRLLGTTATTGDKYRINNLIVTNETPAQQKERSFFVQLQER